MRLLKAALALALLTAGLGIAAAAPAEAATPTCTSWSTYYYLGQTNFVIHVPTAGYQTGTVNCVLKQGNNNDAVTVLQRGLRYCHGYDIAVDGDYGPQTKAAVLGLQQTINGSYGGHLQEDGEYGPQTQDVTKFPVWTWPGNVRTNRCDHSPVF